MFFFELLIFQFFTCFGNPRFRIENAKLRVKNVQLSGKNAQLRVENVRLSGKNAQLRVENSRLSKKMLNYVLKTLD